MNTRVSIHEGTLKAVFASSHGTSWLDLCAKERRTSSSAGEAELTLFPSADLPVWKMQLLAAKINEVMKMEKPMSESNTPEPPEGESIPGEAARPIDPRENNAEATADPGTIPASPIPGDPVDPSSSQGNADG